MMNKLQSAHLSLLFTLTISCFGRVYCLGSAVYTWYTMGRSLKRVIISHEKSLKITCWTEEMLLQSDIAFGGKEQQMQLCKAASKTSAT